MTNDSYASGFIDKCAAYAKGSTLYRMLDTLIETNPRLADRLLSIHPDNPRFDMHTNWLKTHIRTRNPVGANPPPIMHRGEMSFRDVLRSARLALRGGPADLLAAKKPGSVLESQGRRSYW